MSNRKTRNKQSLSQLRETYQQQLTKLKTKIDEASSTSGPSSSTLSNFISDITAIKIPKKQNQPDIDSASREQLINLIELFEASFKLMEASEKERGIAYHRYQSIADRASKTHRLVVQISSVYLMLALLTITALLLFSAIHIAIAIFLIVAVIASDLWVNKRFGSKAEKIYKSMTGFSEQLFGFEVSAALQERHQLKTMIKKLPKENQEEEPSSSKKAKINERNALQVLDHIIEKIEEGERPAKLRTWVVEHKSLLGGHGFFESPSSPIVYMVLRSQGLTAQELSFVKEQALERSFASCS